MLAELRQKSQITIPKELVDRLGLSEGDKLDIYEQEGIICIMPVVVYPKGYVEGLLDDIKEIKRKIATGEQPVFNDIDELISSLESEE
ncbi:MAG: AbrB/MazE/SpoVT family DNA-binding domain-containing protein [Defluviitaleaceae bacterium]|nr:AbrB/MazE/SpoVT family DNA-binding domain-containing protein [Defluviitaleaceae bacterium]